MIIEESLEGTSVLEEVKIANTKIEPVTERHKTPWIKQWTLQTVEIPEEKAEKIAEKISIDLEKEHPWYADFKNDKFHYVIFRGKVFKVSRENPEVYEDIKAHGVSLGIPEYQVAFDPKTEKWADEE